MKSYKNARLRIGSCQNEPRKPLLIVDGHCKDTNKKAKIALIEEKK